MRVQHGTPLRRCASDGTTLQAQSPAFARAFPTQLEMMEEMQRRRRKYGAGAADGDQGGRALEVHQHLAGQMYLNAQAWHPEGSMSPFLAAPAPLKVPGKRSGERASEELKKSVPARSTGDGVLEELSKMRSAQLPRRAESSREPGTTMSGELRLGPGLSSEEMLTSHARQGNRHSSEEISSKHKHRDGLQGPGKSSLEQRKGSRLSGGSNSSGDGEQRGVRGPFGKGMALKFRAFSLTPSEQGYGSDAQFNSSNGNLRRTFSAGSQSDLMISLTDDDRPQPQRNGLMSPYKQHRLQQALSIRPKPAGFQRRLDEVRPHHGRSRSAERRESLRSQASPRRSPNATEVQAPLLGSASASSHGHLRAAAQDAMGSKFPLKRHLEMQETAMRNERMGRPGSLPTIPERRAVRRQMPKMEEPIGPKLLSQKLLVLPGALTPAEPIERKETLEAWEGAGGPHAFSGPLLDRQEEHEEWAGAGARHAFSGPLALNIGMLTSDEEPYRPSSHRRQQSHPLPCVVELPEVGSPQDEAKARGPQVKPRNGARAKEGSSDGGVQGLGRTKKTMKGTDRGKTRRAGAEGKEGSKAGDGTGVKDPEGVRGSTASREAQAEDGALSKSQNGNLTDKIRMQMDVVVEHGPRDRETVDQIAPRSPRTSTPKSEGIRSARALAPDDSAWNAMPKAASVAAPKAPAPAESRQKIPRSQTTFSKVSKLARTGVFRADALKESGKRLLASLQGAGSLQHTPNNTPPSANLMSRGGSIISTSGTFAMAAGTAGEGSIPGIRESLMLGAGFDSGEGGFAVTSRLRRKKTADRASLKEVSDAQACVEPNRKGPCAHEIEHQPRSEFRAPGLVQQPKKQAKATSTGKKSGNRDKCVDGLIQEMGGKASVGADGCQEGGACSVVEGLEYSLEFDHARGSSHSGASPAHDGALEGRVPWEPAGHDIGWLRRTRPGLLEEDSNLEQGNDRTRTLYRSQQEKPLAAGTMLASGEAALWQQPSADQDPPLVPHFAAPEGAASSAESPALTKWKSAFQMLPLAQPLEGQLFPEAVKAEAAEADPAAHVSLPPLPLPPRLRALANSGLSLGILSGARGAAQEPNSRASAFGHLARPQRFDEGTREAGGREELRAALGTILPRDWEKAPSPAVSDNDTDYDTSTGASQDNSPHTANQSNAFGRSKQHGPPGKEDSQWSPGDGSTGSEQGAGSSASDFLLATASSSDVSADLGKWTVAC